MKSVWLISLILMVSACTGVETSEPPVKVFNLSQGLARQDSNGKWEIYEEGSHFVFQTNGQCIANGESKPCMWHAVSFEYTAAAEATGLECSAVFSAPIDVVDPEAIRARKTKKHTFTTELRGLTGKVFWQGYIIRDEDPLSGDTSVSCRNNGKRVLSYSYSITEQPNKPLEPTR